MRQYGMKSGKEYKPEVWNVAKERSGTLIITPDDAEFERTTREEKMEHRTRRMPKLFHTIVLYTYIVLV